MPAVAQRKLPAPRKRGRPPVDASQAIDEGVLLSAAFAMFAERGYEATTLRELSRDLGVSHNLLNVRFGRKSDLWKAAVDWRLATASRDVVMAFDDPGDPETRLHALIFRFCAWATVHPDIVAISYQEGQRDSWRLDYFVARFIRPFQVRLDRLMEEVRADRPMRAISTGVLMALLVQGVGFYFASKPLQDRLGETAHASEDGRMTQARLLAAFIMDGLLERA